MSSEELLAMIQKKDAAARKQVFERYYSRLAAIALRYCKSKEQADELVNIAFGNSLNKLLHNRQGKTTNAEEFLEREFILECVNHIKAIRSEYYVSSTVHATEGAPKNYNLFENNEWIDYNQVDTEVLIKSLHQLVPSQRLVFNLHVIDGLSLTETASILESSEETVKSNLEKARFNLQKNIEKNLKSIKA
jgi:RNA polymerase sigma-70 factor (ECF subfamily)